MTAPLEMPPSLDEYRWPVLSIEGIHTQEYCATAERHLGFPMRELLSQALAVADTDSDCLQSGVVRRTYTAGSSRNKTNPTRRILSFASLSKWLAPTDIGQACTPVVGPGCRHPAPRDQSLPLARRWSCRCPQCSGLVPSCGLCTMAVSIASEHVLLPVEACEVKRVCKRPTKRIGGADNPTEHMYIHA